MLWITARTSLKRASLRVQENADEVQLPFSIPYEQVGCAAAYVRGKMWPPRERTTRGWKCSPVLNSILGV